MLGLEQQRQAAAARGVRTCHQRDLSKVRREEEDVTCPTRVSHIPEDEVGIIGLGKSGGKLSDRLLRLSERTNVCLREMGGLPSSQSDKAWVDEKKRT